MFKSVLYVLAVTASVMVSPLSFAEGAILFVSPHRVVLSPDERTDVVSIANQSDRERKYEMIAVDQVMNENGVTQRKDTFQYSAKRMLRFVPQRVTLKPGERQVVRIMARRPADLLDGDYHSHLLFREVPNKDKTAELAGKGVADDAVDAAKDKTLSFNIGTYFGVAIPVIVQSGQVESSLAMGNVALAPRLQADAPLFAMVPFTRSGNAEASGFLKIHVLDAAGTSVSSQVVWVRAYREVDAMTRRIQVALPQDMPTNAKLRFDLFASDIEGAKQLASQTVEL